MYYFIILYSDEHDIILLLPNIVIQRSSKSGFRKKKNVPTYLYTRFLTE